MTPEMIFKTLTALFAVAFMVQVSAAGNAEASLDPDRIKEVAVMLRKDARAPGWRISDRNAWERLGRDPLFAGMVPSAEKVLGTPLLDQPDDLYLDYSRTGNRRNWERVAVSRRGHLTTLVLAECVENKGRFLPKLEELITALCAERTWVLPAHDGSLVNFNGEDVTIDLASSAVAWNLAMTDWMLGSRLRPEVLVELRRKVRSRVVKPYLDMIRGKREANFWVRATHNWNAVCLAGVTGAGLIECDSLDERAELIAAAEMNSKYFLSGFTPDGYCSEGLGYWNYGFGHFALLSEMVSLVTGGGIVLLAQPEARMPALFGARIEMANGVSPAFADCGVYAKPSAALMWLLNKRLGLGLDRYREPAEVSSLGASGAGGGFLCSAMVCALAARERPSAREDNPVADTLRTWFNDAGVLICRPLPGSKSSMAVAVKGGHNAEHHNHNDLGSFVVLCGKQLMLLDPGNEVYTARTFSKQRYESNLLNSWGHSVPVVAGKLQRPGAEARARVLDTAFTEDSDSVRLDLRSAYECPELKRLERTFSYIRVGTGALTVHDDVVFETPQSFGTALITTGEVRRVDERTLLITNAEEKVRVEIDCGGSSFSIKTEQITEDSPIKPTRIGIELDDPVTAAFITTMILRNEDTP
ncbi:MAG: heparinase II/III family protein [Armatimonadetes bacterium]|nr:heparinase II/III family protein [Armatimonadota bacterium]